MQDPHYGLVRVRARVVMASRMGDVGITSNLDAEDGYESRVWIADLADFGEIP